ncbi:homoserine dehydrogenase [Sandaracinobacteroides saxicola]|uniref:Homoserine dehydrogenase n=1 Tax=Sandaracinobacteroides saxicola TaxID=2759707 RepID=A0A7G5IGR4_9SPHN|nr:homoserine dehydrogenase [Sandaracinobacteroides saxicola]QMW22556.1 homoserine dehydrogenase [Sandaracinobacteroides saxicola]
MNSPSPLRIGLAGLGTVGAGVVRLLDTNAALVARRAGRRIEVSAVSARDRARARGIDLGRFAWEDDATALAARDDVDCVVELVGGADGPALTLARATLAARKPFVTANKAMLAHHGLALAQAAEEAAVPLKFEAAVAGGIPVIKGIREGAAANELARVYGILNGTCNYILTRMEHERLGFAEVLADAQRLGFAEADPTFDIEGIDAAHKLAILASLSFGTRIDFAGVATQGIAAVTAGDIDHAATLGFRIRLVGSAAVDDGRLMQRVHPCLIPLGHPLAAVEGPLNAVVAEGNFVGRLFFQGRGAGEGPTASAVVADLIDIARGEAGPAFAMPVAALAAMAPADPGDSVERCYLRVTVQDRPGVLAELTAALRDAGVSIESLIQRGVGEDGGVFVAMVTHVAKGQAVAAALKAMAAGSSLTAAPVMMPIIER